MAADRITKETADLIAIPPLTIEVQKVKFILNQKKVQENIKNVPLNEPLMESIKKHGIMSPMLIMNNYWPIAGSQRIRALWELIKTEEDGYAYKDIKVELHRFDKDWWNMYLLWPDKEFVNTALAVWFQTVELAWKSKVYEFTKDDSGVEMTEFEKLGDELKGWKHKSSQKTTD